MPALALVIQLLLGLLDRASSIAALIKEAQSQGRDITQAELDTLFAADDAARAELQAEIDKQKAEGARRR